MQFKDICMHVMEESAKESKKAYILIDGAADNGSVIHNIENLLTTTHIYSLFKNTKNDENLLFGPHIIPIEHNNQLLNWYITIGHKYGLLLISKYTPDILFSHFQQYLVCILPDDRHRMFRFYDPFIFYYVWNSLTDSECTLFLGPVSAIVCSKPEREADSEHIVYFAPEDIYNIPDSISQKFPWFVSEATYIALNTPSKFSLMKMIERYFRELYPRTARILGRTRIESFAAKIVEMNENIGLVSKKDLLALMGIVAQLGTGFLTDPQYAHVAAALKKEGSPQGKLYAMSQEVEKIKKDAWHKYGRPYYIALKRAYHKSYEEISRLDSMPGIVNALRNIFPERVSQVGEAAMLDIVEAGKQKSEEWGLTPRPGIALCSGILFFLGIGCEWDPLRPWIGEFIKRELSPVEKTKELYKAIRRILRFNFRSRLLEPEQEQALWLQQFLTPFLQSHIDTDALRRMESLTAGLVGLQPMLDKDVGVHWRTLAEELVEDEPFRGLPLPVRIVLALVLLIEQVQWVEHNMDTDHVLSLCRLDQQEQVVSILAGRLSWLARDITTKLYAEFGGDIL